MSKELKLSASRIKTLESCSWLYYVNYFLKLPDKANDGSSRGSAVHSVLECLVNKRHRKYVKILQNDVRGVDSINKLLLKLAKKHDVTSDENINLMYKFIHTAVKNDFFCESMDLRSAEYEFDIKNDNYRIGGFIDKHCVCDKTKKVIIYDYKTSKAKFNDFDLKNNIQALTYSMAMKERYPDYDTEVNFLFLKFVREPLQKISYSDSQLSGFKEYLSGVYSQLSNFNLDSAQKNMARNSKEHSWMCGSAQYPGELKQDGSPIWYCRAKFPSYYYAIVDKEGNNTRTAFDLDTLKVKEGEIAVRKYYAGCPAHFSLTFSPMLDSV